MSDPRQFELGLSTAAPVRRLAAYGCGDVDVECSSTTRGPQAPAPARARMGKLLSLDAARERRRLQTFYALLAKTTP